MKLKQFKNFDDYVVAQQLSDKRKSRRSSVRKTELEKLSEYLIRMRGLPSSGICHGARYGVEVLLFRELFKRCKVIGTDLIYDKPGLVINADFHVQRKEWIGAFDFLYSNALDHSHSPKKCLEVWMEQLKPNGLAFVMWTTFHRKLKGGDCFGALLHEYMQLANQIGTIVDLIYCDRCARTKKNLKTLIAIKPNT